MMRTNTDDTAGRTADGALDRARQAAAQVKPAARSTGAAARRRVHRTRSWAAPQVEHTGQVLQDSIAPKVSALLSSAAQRIEPAKPRRPRWRMLAGISVLIAAAGAVAALARNRRKPDCTTPAEPGADEMRDAAQMRNGRAGASADAEAGTGADAEAGTGGDAGAGTEGDAGAGTGADAEVNGRVGTS